MNKDKILSFRVSEHELTKLNYLLRKYNIDKAKLIRHMINMQFKNEFTLEHLLEKKK